ncbi:MAG: glycoside hydrolase family 9 protein [Acidobacteria bacterium]|nr:glycoside hydrolase family 9 protein [Acidobacteriota bacterium]
MAVPNVHPACHLDDAIRRDTGEHADVAGGWHDAGDVRKWMDATMLVGIGILQVARNLEAAWDLAGPGLQPLLEEVKWGSRYFLKMQDRNGRVWADTGGGVNGDNSDNHWTDNQTGNADDRHVNVNRLGQGVFMLPESLVAQVYREHDPAYGRECMDAARRCFQAEGPDHKTLDLGWWTLAALEMDRADPGDSFKSAAATFARQLLDLQNTEFVGAQKVIRGFWRTAPDNSTPYKNWFVATPQALLEMLLAYPRHPDAPRWRDAVRLYLDEYVVPLCSRSVYRIMPVGVFLSSDNDSLFRPIGGTMWYRFFGTVRGGDWTTGLNSHLMGHAVLLARASQAFRERNYRGLACRQLEWVVGANPFGASMMTGVGYRNPYPFSVFAGLISGGILNGIGGNSQDQPVLSFDCGSDYRTTEYWSPHSCYYEWAISLLEQRL